MIVGPDIFIFPSRVVYDADKQKPLVLDTISIFDASYYSSRSVPAMGWRAKHVRYNIYPIYEEFDMFDILIFRKLNPDTIFDTDRYVTLQHITARRTE